MKVKLTAERASELIKEKLSTHFGLRPEDAGDEYIYKAVVLAVKDILVKNRNEFIEKAEQQNSKQVYYLCMEFLMGRSLKNNLFNLGITEPVRKALAGFNVKLDKIYEMEPDAGLGNGGLGRLAACYLDGLASQKIPAMGYSIRYEYGIFRQKLVDGWQTELPDFWLPGGEVWFVEHPEDAVEVRFDGHVRDWWDGSFHHVEHTDYSPVMAVPHDMMVAGADGKGVSLLRLWSAESPGLDMKLFNEGDYMRAIEQESMAQVISKVLYPADNHPEGKSLRLRQQYFLVSASIQDIVKNHLKKHSIDELPDFAAIHTNDTHPVLAIPELMRILLDECGYPWDKAWDIVTKTVAYTNHTVMSEALECWSAELFAARLPRIFQIVTEIDNRHRAYVWEQTHDADFVERTAVIHDGVVKMANLAVAACHKVNGVSRLHSEILKNDVFKDFYRLTPDKFTNVTNGIAHRRWLCQANPELSDYLKKLIGGEFITDASKLEKLLEYKDDSAVKADLMKIKRNNKIRLAEYIKKTGGGDCDPDSIFDIQIKRMHEYKRQHMNALHILSEYLYIKENPAAPFVPKTYIFGAKSAPGYYLAKQIIQLICSIAKLVDGDPDMKGKLKVVYVEDYRVTLAELLVPAADISEQISLAGTEASGTGNMKLMLNGAVTLGTEDGANVEIHEAVGDDNIVIFGMTADEAKSLKNGYNPRQYYYNNPKIKQAVDMLGQGFCGHDFGAVASALLDRDNYMALADFESYCRAHERVDEIYKNPDLFAGMSLVNIAKAGRFAADRAVEEYAKNIWNCKPVK